VSRLDYFKEEPRGTVVAMEPEEFTGAIYHVWFPYARSYMSEVREGGLVAVRNFQSREPERTYSILEMVTALPVHYALGTSPADTDKAFPGFVVEAAKSAKLDWEQEVPVEHTTKIRAEAIPTGLQLVFNGGSKEPKIDTDTSLAMIGEEAFLLTNDMVLKVINRGLTHEGANVITPCKLSLNKDIDICVKVDDLLRTHFGIFGFTGAGKSNLLSTLVHRLANHKGREPIKIVLFDLMSEYTALTMDLIHDIDGAFILSLETDAVLGGSDTLAYLNGKTTADEASETIARTLLLPKELGAHRSSFSLCIRGLLEGGKLKMLDATSEPPEAAQLHEQLMGLIPANTSAEARRGIVGWLDTNIGSEGQIPYDAIKGLVPELTNYIRRGEIDVPMPGAQTRIDGGNQMQGMPLKAKGAEALEAIRAVLQGLVDQASNPPPAEAAITFSQLVKLLNSADRSTLIIVQSDRDDALRNFSAQLINTAFNIRRRIGQISPSMLFVFDEADEFMPQGTKEDDSYGRSRAAITTLARRGRKFGMGMAIATQRIAYLDTSIMAQPHTYFISKLPREYDREAMSKAFGITDDMMRKTLKFTKGQWLLVSFDATGLENIPIPVQFENANKRILGHLQEKHKVKG